MELDVVLTASQKQFVPRIGVLMAKDAWENRKTPVPNYYADWNNWLPIMSLLKKEDRILEPAVNLIVALETS
jgi:alanine-glyoxylate transaminase/serine-glyoxylate transaminase/serine-pyruvate transaminase